MRSPRRSAMKSTAERSGARPEQRDREHAGADGHRAASPESESHGNRLALLGVQIVTGVAGGVQLAERLARLFELVRLGRSGNLSGQRLRLLGELDDVVRMAAGPVALGSGHQGLE